MCRTYSARGGGRSESKEVGSVRVYSGVAARVSDVSAEGGDLEEKGGISLRVVVEFLVVGKDAA
jgi:hypothetical protein